MFMTQCTWRGGGDPIIAWVVFIVGPIVSKGYVWEEYVVYSHRISTARKVKGWGQGWASVLCVLFRSL